MRMGVSRSPTFANGRSILRHCITQLLFRYTPITGDCDQVLNT
jgi:hypothetical protein